MTVPFPPLETSEPASAPLAQSVRDRLLCAASRLFYAEGIRAVGIDRILAESGAAKASLYAHFASKDELVLAYMATQATAVRTALIAGLDEGEQGARARLLRLFTLAISVASAPGFRGCPFRLAASEITDPSHPALRIVAEQQAWLRNLIRDLVAACDATAPPEFSAAVFTLYEGALSASAATRSAEAVIAARWAVEQLLEGVTSSAAGRRRKGA